METYELSSGTVWPKIGFGTWKLAPDALANQAVLAALAAGYRIIDTAKIYNNEVGVGQAIKASSLARDEIFVTTKLWTSDLGYDSALAAFDASLAKLGLVYVDLYLIHWPGDDASARAGSWRALEEIHASGRAKAIGVSNYKVEHLQELLAHAKVQPAVNQIELHPFNYRIQKPVVEFCQQQGILVEAYSPLAQASQLDNPALATIASEYSKTPAQIMLRWAIQKGALPIPRSSNPSRIRKNLDVFDFELNTKSIQGIDELTI